MTKISPEYGDPCDSDNRMIFSRLVVVRGLGFGSKIGLEFGLVLENFKVRGLYG
jgi:hypothetical protein